MPTTMLELLLAPWPSRLTEPAVVALPVFPEKLASRASWNPAGAALVLVRLNA